MKPNSDFNSLPFAARWTIILFGAAGLAALLYVVASQPGIDLGRTLLLLTLAAGSARIKFNLFKGSTLSFLTSVVLLAVIHEGPAVAVLVGLCGVTVQTIFPSKKVVLHQLAFNAGMIAITVTASWLTYHLVAGRPTLNAISSNLVATVLASFAYFVGNSVSVSLIVAMTKGLSVFQIWFHHFLFSAPSFVFAGMLSLTILAMFSSPGIVVIAAFLAAISTAYYCSVRLTAQPAA